MDRLGWRTGSLSNRATPISSASPIPSPKTDVSTPPVSKPAPLSSATLPLPEQPGLSITNLASLKASPLFQILDRKRKRPEDSEPINFATQKSLRCPTPPPAGSTAAPTQAGAAVVAPVAKPRCSTCNGTLIKPGDILVACAHCPITVHQQCSRPPIDEFRARDGSFLCKDCLLSGEGHAKPRRQQLGASTAQLEDLERIRRDRLGSLPAGIVPAKPELVGFRAGDASSHAQFEYFDFISRTDALNILSFADQLKPNLLTEILMSVTKRYPDLPIFDAPDWAARLSSSSSSNNSTMPSASHSSPHLHAPRSIVKSQIGRPRHGHVLPHGKAKHRAPKPGETRTKKVLKRTRIVEVPVEALPNGGEVDDVNNLPPSWKNAGPGWYADLPPETEDRRYLVDTNDEEAFSHFMAKGLAGDQQTRDRHTAELQDAVGAARKYLLRHHCQATPASYT